MAAHALPLPNGLHAAGLRTAGLRGASAAHGPGLLASASMDGAAARAASRAVRRAADAQLVQRVLGGDGEAFRTLVERYQRQVYWVAHDILLDADEARDVAQETFLRVHSALTSFDRSRDFLNWVYRIARNLAIDAHRRRRRRAAPVEDLSEVAASEATEASALTSAHEVRERVNAVLAEMPVDYRLALSLRELHGLTPLEIARITDCSYPTARWRLHRARQIFKQRWEARFGPGRAGAEAR